MNHVWSARPIRWLFALHLLTNAGAVFSDEAVTASDAADTDSGKGNFVWAPIPLLEEALGGGVVMVGMYFYPPEEYAPPSITGVAAGYTSTDSYMLGAGHDHHFAGNRWRLESGVGYAKFNLGFHGIGAEPGDLGRSLNYSIEGAFAQSTLWRKFPRGWAVGVGAEYLDADVSFQDSVPEDPISEKIPSGQLNLTSLGAGLFAEKDTRDNRFSPSTGRFFNTSAVTFPGGLDNDVDYHLYKAAYSQYWPVRDTTVLAANVSTGYADGNAPFYRLSKLSIRGVSAQAYWDNFLLQGQVEARQEIWGNWSAALFAGYGGVSSSLKKLDNDNMIFAGGTGVRYQVAQKEKVAVRLDVAWGQDGAMVYISVGEAF